MKFSDLALIYIEKKIIPPVYHRNKKIAGMRSWKNQLGFLKPLVAYFGKRPIKEIKPMDIEAYKLMRLQTPVLRGGGERSFAHVNRELSRMRAMLNYAKRQDWIAVNPFEKGDRIISPADEEMRQRILSLSEESAMLALCVGGKRQHVRSALIGAVDTGLRKGEQFTLIWSDIDFEKRVIRLRAFNAKSAKSREVPITNRLLVELLKLKLKGSAAPDDMVWNCGDVKRAFAYICEKCGVENMRWHDLRHTFATRLVQAGLPMAELARLLGHSTIQMAYRYTNATPETTSRAAEMLNKLMAEVEKSQPPQIEANEVDEPKTQIGRNGARLIKKTK